MEFFLPLLPRTSLFNIVHVIQSLFHCLCRPYFKTRLTDFCSVQAEFKSPRILFGRLSCYPFLPGTYALCHSRRISLSLLSSLVFSDITLKIPHNLINNSWRWTIYSERPNEFPKMKSEAQLQQFEKYFGSRNHLIYKISKLYHKYPQPSLLMLTAGL